MKNLLTSIAIATLFVGLGAIDSKAAQSYIVKTNGALCPADTAECSPVNAGDGSVAFLSDEHSTDGAGYIAIRFGENPPSEGTIEFFLGSATIYLQTCVFSPSRTEYNNDWPIASQFQLYSAQVLGSRAINPADVNKYAVTVEYRALGLLPNKVYALAFHCAPKTH